MRTSGPSFPRATAGATAHQLPAIIDNHNRPCRAQRVCGPEHGQKISKQAAWAYARAAQHGSRRHKVPGWAPQCRAQLWRASRLVGHGGKEKRVCGEERAPAPRRRQPPLAPATRSASDERPRAGPRMCERMRSRCRQSLSIGHSSGSPRPARIKRQGRHCTLSVALGLRITNQEHQRTRGVRGTAPTRKRSACPV